MLIQRRNQSNRRQFNIDFIVISHWVCISFGQVFVTLHQPDGLEIIIRMTRNSYSEG